MITPDDTCGAPHEPISAPEAIMMIRGLYAVGLSYHVIADLTRLSLSHVQVRTLLQLPELLEQSKVLEAMKL